MGRSSKFDVGFRVHAVELARMSRRPRCQIAEELGISDTTLSKWMAQSENDRAPDPLTISDRAELDQLRVEKREWILERKILRKAMAFWVKEFRG
jgi:transposase